MSSIQPTFLNGVLSCAILSVAIVCCIPSSPFEMVNGLVFGWYGAIISVCALTLGSCASFLLGRSPLLSGVAIKLQENETIRLFSVVLEKNLWQYLLLTRVAQIPIFLKNYGFAVIPQVEFGPFFVSVVVVSSFLCPVWTYVGIMTKDMGEDSDRPEPFSVKALKIGSAVLGVVALVVIGIRAWKGIQREGKRQRELRGQIELRSYQGDEGVTTPNSNPNMALVESEDDKMGGLTFSRPLLAAGKFGNHLSDEEDLQDKMPLSKNGYNAQFNSSD
eukprot:GDKJ01022576.1.p1 GENE.GDKJ01022576.1~~GDKJ01022576.1.p1  ORF type:complete len:319 (+),score=48.50 GDKJ01022576.1:134-958(+)